jgi:2-phospho-L-lactate guanylyltransferase (CobY/MobA/RfbA family)
MLFNGQDEIETLGHPSSDVIVCDSNDGGTQKVFCKANSDARHMCQLQKLGMKR